MRSQAALKVQVQRIGRVDSQPVNIEPFDPP